jgi:hypothetical protein
MAAMVGGVGGAELRAIGVAVIGAALLVVLGGLVGTTSGLLFVAGVTGGLVGLIGAGSARPKSWVRRFSIALAVAVVVLGAVGAWLVGLAQGGDLGLFDFLWATSGLLVPAELLAAILAAAWGAGAGPIRMSDR